MKSNFIRRCLQLVTATILACSSLNGALSTTTKAKTIASPDNNLSSLLQLSGTAEKPFIGKQIPAPNPIVIDENLSGVTLELTVKDYVLEDGQSDGKACQVFRAENFSSSDKSGSPNLPVKSSLVGIPAGGNPFLTVLEAIPEELPGNFNLCPVSSLKINYKPDGTVEYEGEEYTKDMKFYAQDGFFPDSPVDLMRTAFIRSQRVAQINFQPFQYNPTTGKVRYYKTIRVQVNFGLKDGLANKVTQPKDEGVYEEILSKSVVNYDTSADYRQVRRSSRQADAPESGVQMKAKVIVNQGGVIKVTYENLASAGLDFNDITPATIQLFNRGVEIPIDLNDGQDGSFDPGDFFVFYGQKLAEKYTDANVYWLTWGSQTGQRIQSLSAAPANAKTSPNYLDPVRLEKNSTYLSNYIDSRGDNWYWSVLSASSSKPASYSFDFTLDHVNSTTTKEAYLSGSFVSLSASTDHHTRIFVNGNFVTEKIWSYGAQYDFNVSFPMQYLAEGTNTIRVDIPMDGSRIYDNILLNWFEVSCWKTFFASNNGLTFSGEVSGETRYEIDGFSSPNVGVFDITNPASPVNLTDTAMEQTANGFKLGFQTSTANQHRYTAFSEQLDITPEVVKETASHLHASSNRADYLLISHASFLDAMQPLVNWRTIQGFQVMLIDVQDIYDEFNDGIVNADAIHEFIDYAYHNWQAPAPQYVLLVGDGNYDPHNYLGTNEKTFIPPYQLNVDRYLTETASDNRYVAVSGDDNIPDLMIGRLPVKTSAEANAVVAKMLNYEQLPYDTGWNQNMLFVADNPDLAGDFHFYSDRLVNTLLPNGYTPNKVHYGQTHTTVSSAKSAILDGINNGSMVVNYVGHGTVSQWASENLLSKTSISSMTNTDKPSFFAMLACLTGYFTTPSASNKDNSSLAEALVKENNKAAIATWASSGFGMAEGQDHLDRGLFKAIFYDGQTRLGAATLQAKLYLMSQAPYFPDLLDTYTLFGDPATKLNVRPSDLAVQLTASSSTNLLVGSPITYTLTYGNQGLAEASSVQIDQALPDLLSNPTITRSDIGSARIQATQLSADLEKLDPGESGAIVVTGIVNSDRSTTISSQATIVSPIPDANLENNTAGPVQTSVVTENPTAVTFESTSIMAAPQMILLNWITESDIQIIGFNVYRSNDPNSLGIQLNQNLIMTQNPGSMYGASYEFQDHHVLIGETYYYTIETIEREGTGTQGPLVATAKDFAFLPLAAR